MKNKPSKLALTAGVAGVFTASVFALTGEGFKSTFESEVVKKIKEKFKSFSEKTKEDRIYVQTDKALYKPGETVWFSAHVRDAETLQPSTNSEVVHIEFISPKGNVEKHYKLVCKNGAAQGDLDLTDHLGGIYKIKAYTEYQKNNEHAFYFEKEIQVQAVVMPRLKMKLDFEKKAYGKGDEVIASLNLNTNENKALANEQVAVKALLDGKALLEKKVTTDDKGKATIQFSLPKDLKTIDGMVNVLIDYEGSTESISRSIPIILNQIKLELFPEGGDMVNGVQGRVAFRALNEFGKAADIEGFVFDDKDKVITKFTSFHNGLGAFDLMPLANTSYKIKLTKPEGVGDIYNIPDALEKGYALGVKNTANNSLITSIYSFQPETLSLVAQTRGKIFYAGSFNALKGENLLSISSKDFPIGISQITLFDSKGIARAERLVFVNKDRQTKVSITSDKPQYKPREKVGMNIRVTDANGLPVSGNFSLAVVDDNLLTFSDDKQGTILSKMLLEPELKEKVEEPNFYFDPKEPKADQALDYVMLTSGWRKYSWKKITSGDIPEIKFAGEKTILSGVVMSGYENKPIAGAKLKLKASGRSVTTDKEGKFEIKNFDITRDNEVEISAPNFTTQKQALYNYQSGVAYYLYDNRMIRYYDRMPMAAAMGGAVEKRERGAMGNVKYKNVEREEVIMDEAVIATKVAGEKMDMEPLPKKDEAEKEDFELNDKDIQQAEVGDLRFAGIKKADKKMAEGEQIVFYRAKEFPVKKYSKSDTSRTDFETTTYWNGNVETDNNGKARVEFVTNDLISSFKATLEGFGDDGSVAHGEMNYSTLLPFSMDVKLPVELVSGDKINVPVFLKNNTNDAINGLLHIAEIPCLKLLSSNNQSVTIPAHQSILVYVNFVANSSIGDCSLAINFDGKDYKDNFAKPIRVIANGFPANISLSGQDLSKDFSIRSSNVVAGSMKVKFTAYPNIMTELMSGVESILREPYGCFEQTSSSNYPNIMVLSYLKNMQVKNPELEKKATQLLDAGYKKLVSFETKENGYEWFGAAPAHEALTAYGLMEFEDMKKVYPKVDQAMIDRTGKLLLEKRDGNGGFKKNPRALDSFGGADEDITNAYIVYALSEAGYKDIQKELDAAYKNAKKSSDPYLMALVANALFNTGDQKRGDEILKEIVKEKNEYGFWTGKKHSITRSTGEALKIETTSLIALAVMKSENPDNATLTSAVKYLVGARSGFGGFGSTQSTVLALKALTKYAEFSKKTDEAGIVEIYQNDKLIASKGYEKGEKGNVVIGGLEKFIGDGKQKISVKYKGCKKALPYSMNISYSTTLPESSAACVLSLETKIEGPKTVKVGETMRIATTLKNTKNEGQPMSMAIIGIPAGFTAQPWQLKELQEKQVVDFYELIGNNVVCYYRDLAPNETKQINLDLKAEIPGSYEAPASSAYLYYTNENKVWKGLDRVTVNP